MYHINSQEHNYNKTKLCAYLCDKQYNSAKFAFFDSPFTKLTTDIRASFFHAYPLITTEALIKSMYAVIVMFVFHVHASYHFLIGQESVLSFIQTLRKAILLVL